MHLQLSEERVARHQAFLRREPANQPLVGSWLFGFYVPDLYPRVAEALRPGPVLPADIPLEAFLADVDVLAAAYAELDDDYPFSVGALASIPWLEAIMGCPIHFSGTTFWAEPCITDWAAHHWSVPAQGSAWRAKLLELLDALVVHAAGRYACSPTLMRGVADMCAAMRGSNALALDFYDHPARVQRLAGMCAEVLVEVGLAQLALIPESENGYMVGSAGLRCWFPGKGVWLQDDAISILSPRLYQKLFLSEVRRVADRFPWVAFHLHGDQLWPLDIFLELEEVDVLELNYDLGATTLDEHIIPAWRKIQAHKPCIAFAHVSQQEAARIRDMVPGTGFAFQTLSETVQAGRTMHALMRHDLL